MACWSTRGQFVLVDRRRLGVDNVAIEQRTRHTLAAALDGALRTTALTLRVRVTTTQK
jgi:hypothetical protein